MIKKGVVIIISKEYWDYLHSPMWYEKRDAVLRRDRYCCRVCGSRERVDVHHINYKRIFHERDSDLMVLCNSCHRLVHTYFKQKDKIKEVARYEYNRFS